MALRVLIAGAGIGGLCLAQGLRKAGIDALVFERDVSAQVRGQGFRFRIDPDGDAALKACLTQDLYDLYQATSSHSSPPSAAYDFKMREIFRMDSRPGIAPQHTAVNRRTLREVLTGHLENTIHFNHTLQHVDQTDDTVTATFANGATASGDMLVAADGINSVVRHQLLPDVEPIDTGMRCIYGTTPLTTELLYSLPDLFLTGFVPFAGPDRQTLAIGIFRPGNPIADTALKLTPTVKLTPIHDYLMWLCVAPLDLYATTDDDLRTATPSTLHQKALNLTKEWHPTLRQILQQAEVSALFQVPIRTSPPIPTWPSTRITLLGDAIHAMTPAGGIGANTAMRDAALLTDLLTTAHRGEISLLNAITQYETEMRLYGTAAVRQSLEGATRLYRISTPESETIS
jgi:2-polyprenyl-6-methoxyphenol hydroxylase-like FAD-dependent oxidoreductase